MAWIFSPELGVWPSHSSPGSTPSLTVRSTDSAKECFCRVWLMGHFLEVRYGTTCHRSLAPCYQLSTSSTEASPARTSALLALEKAWQESAASWFSRRYDWSLNYDQASSSWKTSLQFDSGDLLQSSGDWPNSGMTVAGTCWALTTWERRTKETDGGFWPTPTARDYRSPGVSRSRRALERNRFALPLSVAFKMKYGYRLPASFVEFLMGYVPQHTVLNPLVMQWFRSVRAKRSAA